MAKMKAKILRDNHNEQTHARTHARARTHREKDVYFSRFMCLQLRLEARTHPSPKGGGGRGDRD